MSHHATQPLSVRCTVYVTSCHTVPCQSDVQSMSHVTQSPSHSPLSVRCTVYVTSCHTVPCQSDVQSMSHVTQSSVSDMYSPCHMSRSPLSVRCVVHVTQSPVGQMYSPCHIMSRSPLSVTCTIHVTSCHTHTHLGTHWIPLGDTSRACHPDHLTERASYSRRYITCFLMACKVHSTFSHGTSDPFVHISSFLRSLRHLGSSLVMYTVSQTACQASDFLSGTSNSCHSLQHIRAFFGGV